LQTFPCIAFGLAGRWFHHRALFAGWCVGMLLGMMLVGAQHFTAITMLTFGDRTLPVYTALAALVANMVVATLLTPTFDRLGVPRKAFTSERGSAS
jgi:SSS family solute:Na+ symporter